MPLVDCLSYLSDNTRVKRAFQLFAVLLFAFTLLRASPVYAEGWVGKNFGIDNDNAKLNATMNKNAYLNDSFYGQVMSVNCAIIPWFGPDNCTNNKEIQQSMLKKSALGNIAMAIGAMYSNPPADLALWVRNTGQTLGFIPHQAYAQGVGFSGLSPLLPVWRAIRNMSYLLLALAMIIVGFMVMLRKKIDPKTVVTVQNSLPRIVIALILITFSYAIVGLMIDIMYILISFVTILIQTSLPGPKLIFPINYTTGGLWDLFQAVFQQVSFISPTATLGNAIGTGDWQVAADAIGSSLLWVFTLGGLGLGPLFQIIIAIAYLIAFIRILFMLLGSYVQIILAVITGPLQILADVFPGSEGFSNWLKGLAANLLIFPITIALLVFGNSLSQHLGEERLWVPPMLIQSVDITGLTKALITLGIIWAIPNIARGAKEAFKTKPLVSFGGMGGAMGTMGQLLTYGFYIRSFLPQKQIPGAVGLQEQGGGESKKH
jgi:hypothetical protein